MTEKSRRVILISIQTTDEIEKPDWEAFGDAIHSEIKRVAVKGQQFAGKDLSGKRRQWYTPEVTVKVV